MSGVLAGARWAEYEELLRAALAEGYAVVSLDAWVRAGGPASARTLVLRHDVDQRPAAAITMAAIEQRLGIASTWYVRWSTAHPRVVDELRARGMTVGLHYETLTRLALQAGRHVADAALVERARELLRGEIEIFRSRFGAIGTICPHGDSRVPGVRNLDLVRGQDVRAYGVDYDGNEVLRGVGMRRLTDRPAPQRWTAGERPARLFAAGVSPILAVVHPNHWTARGALALDRVCARVAPDPLTSRRRIATALVYARSEHPPAP